MLAGPMLDPEFPLWSGHVDPRRSWVPYATAWVLGGLGLTLAAAAGLRRAARRRFVARVGLGLLPRWRLVEAPPERAALMHLPCLGETAVDCDHLLLRCECPGVGTYRRAATEWPAAWVPRTWLRS
jgi:hypothetical protein